MVGEIAEHNPSLVRAIAEAGHEVASHSWNHQRVHSFTPATFRADVCRCKDALEQVTGEAVVGFRAPTFSIVRQTLWAIDVLAELGMLYDSSIYPVRHDRYGMPDAPRWPFLARGETHTLLELPPATWRVLGTNLAVGGGGYFRLFPLAVMRRGIAQTLRQGQPPVAMLYFHPWEFDPEQDRLPLSRLSRFRTYVGLPRSRGRLTSLLDQYVFERAVDVAATLGLRLAPGRDQPAVVTIVDLNFTGPQRLQGSSLPCRRCGPVVFSDDLPLHDGAAPARGRPRTH